MAAAVNLVSLVRRCRQDVVALLSSLHTVEDEDQWTKLLNNIQTQSKETKWAVLYVLKAVILKTETVMALKNLMQIFVRKVSDLVAECDVLKSETLSTEFLAVLKDFWALCSNQHYALTQLVFGTYTSDLYDVLPSLASLYIELFIASNSSKDKAELLSKRLHGWLSFELNDRCLKTALLEVSTCTHSAANFLLPLLRKVLLSPPPKGSFMDYLLHFLVLRRWALLSSDLSDITQINLNVKAPKHFVSWLSQKWANAGEHLPQDKSLKGRRVSELLCSLDSETVEELIDVFSECLSSVQSQENEAEAQVDAETAGAGNLFVIDKTGREQDGAPPKKKQKVKGMPEGGDLKSSTATSNGDNERESAIKQKAKKSKHLAESSKEDARLNEASALGFVLDRSPSKMKRPTNDGLVLEENEEIEGETRVEGIEIESIDDADSETNHDREESDDDNADDVEERNAAGDEKGEGGSSDEDIDGNEEKDDDVLDIDGEDGSNDDTDGSEVELVDSNDDDDDYGSEAEVDDSNDDIDDDDVEIVEDENGGEDKDPCDNETAGNVPPAPVVFPKCAKDPALSYFVNSSPAKDKNVREVEVKITDEMDIQVIETVDSENDVPAKRKVSGDSSSLSKQKLEKSDTAHSGNGISRKGKRKLSENEVELKTKETNSDSMTQSVRNIVPKGDDGEQYRRSKRLRTESGSSLSGKDLPAEAEALSDRSSQRNKTRKISEESLGQLDSKQADNKMFTKQGKGERLEKDSRVKVTPPSVIDLDDEEFIGNGNKAHLKMGEDSLHVSEGGDITDGGIVNRIKSHRRLRSESESFSSKTTVGTASSVRSHNTRRVKTLSESHVGHGGGLGERTSAVVEEKDKSKQMRIHSLKKKIEEDKESSTEESKVETAKETGKDVTTTEQVGLVLSQIRKSMKDDVLQNEELVKTRSSTRLRTTSESIDVKAQAKAKTTARRRQTLTGIKAKEEETSKASSNGGSTNLLMEWLRKPSKKVEVPVEVENMKSAPESAVRTVNKAGDKTSPTVHGSRSDEEVAFNHNTVGKTYTSLTKRRTRSPKRLLIEAKRQEESSKFPCRKSPGKTKSSSPQTGHEDKVLSSDTLRKQPVNNAEDAPQVISDPRPPGEEGSELTKTPKATPSSRDNAGPGTRRRKYYLRGTSPVKSPTEAVNKSLTEKTLPPTSSSPSSSSSVIHDRGSSPRKSPANRRKSLRSSSKPTR